MIQNHPFFEARRRKLLRRKLFSAHQEEERGEQKSFCF
jgi:hypothetical protein